MTNVVIKQIPNALTTLRLLLSVPICLLILNENYSAVLWIALIAGVSDAVDGWLARKLDIESRYGSIVDPLSDKAMLMSSYLAFAIVGLLPWWVAVVIVARDAVIVSGALAYYGLFGRYEVAPSIWGKTSTTVQIVFALMLLTQQVYPVLPALSFEIGLWSVILMVIISGCHYVYIWGAKALSQQNHMD
ncbi:CDP-alcohol phosphatidyltransferase family protein [Moritella sp. Urea-trap-13]|uniref:CDP-alcohol phosphatidyltransferase family protein n=1 Tax=Moritella sp. Urea-trap-13 TaxID=2058327 RepID=UPI000C34BAB4|nr:CDP-alcohol phosphatidyltransferase family protein [Moritella sp. Urea-trap-13]PKH06187.1 CDP-alcohol phosphatidyltransferase family protein [Moritella sp. Urea-trap-13]